MILIEHPRADDNLREFGELLRFAALVYENEDEGKANGAFEPYNIDGDVVFPVDPEQADRVFDAWVIALRQAEDQFLGDGEE